MTRRRLTIRARLTLVYGGLFMLAGLLMLGTTYLLVAANGPRGTLVKGTTGLPPGAEPPQEGERGQFVIQQVVNGARNDTLKAVLAQGGIALVAVGSAATAFGWIVAGQMLQPLHRITETAKRIADAPAADRGLHERIALDGPHDEVKELADTFDAMIERLDQSFDGQRRFIANASHEMRTPLTLNRALIEVALRRETVSADTRRLGETLLDVNARHERLIDGLLLLARSEREVTDRSYVDLADVVEHVVAQAPAGAVTVTAEAAEAPTLGNPVLLERLVQNLVDNGMRHNIDAGGWLIVRCGTRADGSVALEVSNTGPVVPPYEVHGLFEPFRRLGGDASPGTGLGLSIVRAVARAHGGTVRAVARPEGGLVVQVTLPGTAPVRG